MPNNKVAEYYSSEELDVNVEEINKKRKVRRIRNWEMKHCYASINEAMEYINFNNMWSRIYTNNTNEGKKIYFRCTQVKKREEQCPAGLFLLIKHVSEEVILYETAEPHQHVIFTEKTLSIKAKQEIEKLFNLNIKPKRILEILTEEGISLKNKCQLNNYLSKLRQKKYGPSKISLGELEDWCINHSNIPDSDIQPYVISYYINYCDDNSIEDNELENVYNRRMFRVFISTKKLLRNSLLSKVIHADATYKLNWEGMPVLIVGISDMDKHFHPCGIAVCSNETTADFQFIFNTLKEGVASLGGILQPIALVSDACYSIRKAFVQVFGENTILIMCWAHVRRNISKHLNLVNPELQNEVLEDIDSLQLASNPQIFHSAMNLFIKKWIEKNQNRFVDYMNLQWFDTHQNWYEGIAAKVPSTNNCLESFNLVIKKEYTLRERLPIARFFQVCLSMTESWSRAYINSHKTIAESVTIDLKLWTESYQWAKSNKSITSREINGSTEYCCPSNNKICANSKDIVTVLEMKWNNFEQYKERGFSIWITTLPNDHDNWRSGNCTCPIYYKRYICKHIVGLAIRLKYVKPPTAAKQIPIGEKRKRGRPKKATQALLID